MQSRHNQKEIEHSITGDINLSSAEMLNRYLKPHHSSTQCKPVSEDHLLIHTSAEKSQPIKKKDYEHSTKLSYIPTFTEKEIKVYQKLGQGKWSVVL